MLLGPLFWYCEIQGLHTFLGLRRLDPHQGSARDLSGAYNVPRPPAMLSNDLWSLHILSKTRPSIPHLLGGGGGGKILSVFCRGEETFLTLPLQENYIPPTHRKNGTSLSYRGQMVKSLGKSIINMYSMGASALGITNQDVLSEEIENDPFLNSALQRFICELYYRFGSFLAPLIITSRHDLSVSGQIPPPPPPYKIPRTKSPGQNPP